MATHSLEMLRVLESAGFERTKAEAIADVVATHTDESHATKADIANLRAELKADIADLRGDTKALNDRVNRQTNLFIGLYIGIALLLLDRLF